MAKNARPGAAGSNSRHVTVSVAPQVARQPV